jgi:anti-sigma regulatory factor (Ser/Thr protein kinase)
MPSKSSAPSPESSPSNPAYAPRLAVYTARFENLDPVRTFVAEAAEACSLEPAAIYAVQLAVDEAFTNIVEHAYGGECDEKIECICQVARNGLNISLRDCGKPFDPQAVPSPDLEAGLEEREVGGLGLYFIYQLMDKVQFSFFNDPETGKTCNVLKLYKRKER